MPEIQYPGVFNSTDLVTRPGEIGSYCIDIEQGIKFKSCKG